MANKSGLLLLIPLMLPFSARALVVGSQWQLDSSNAGAGADSTVQLWLGYERETQMGLVFIDGQSAGVALPLYKQSFIALGISPMVVADHSRFGALWRMGWQLDDEHQLSIGQLYDVTGRYGQLWYMEHSLPLPASVSLNLWLTRGDQAYMSAYESEEGWREWGMTLERSWTWNLWKLGLEAGAKQWLMKERDWQPTISLTLRYQLSL
ncbi:TPA: hypothetical protein ACSP84_002558 [Aeromonas veronii]